MKKYLWLLILVTFCYSQSVLNGYYYRAKGGAPPSCTTLALSDSTIGTDYLSGFDANQRWAGLMFTTAGALNACKINLYLKRQVTDNLPAFTIDTIFIYNTTANLPTTRVATSNTGILAMATLTTSYVWYTWTFASPVSLSATTEYAVVVRMNNIGDYGDYWLGRKSTVNGDKQISKSADGSSWSGDEYGYPIDIKIFQ